MAQWSQLHLMRPEWLWALLPALFLMLLLWRQRQQSGGWSEVIAPELLRYLVGPNTIRRGPNLLPFILLAWICAVLAAAGPSWQKIPQPIHQKQDAMVMVLDLSYSMKAEDLAPSRLDRARQKLLDILAARKEGQTGLIAYAGDAHIVTPLTDDNPTIANLLPVLSPDMMPLPGSNSPAAIRQAIALLHSVGVTEGKILLLTDGIDAEAAKEIASLLRDNPMPLTIVGVGSANGAPIPMAGGGFLKDSSGTIVVPKLDAPGLAEVAQRAGGRYLDIQLDNRDLDFILADVSLPGQTRTLALDRTADAWEDQGYLLIVLLLPLVLPLFRRGWLLALLPLLFFSNPQPASAQTWDSLWLTPDQQGRRALEAGDAKAAASLFESEDWAGTAAYQGEDFEGAVEHFSSTESADSFYNRGNALARAGKLDEAIDAYKESLSRSPEQTDAKENLALLEKMKEQQQEQQDQDGEGEDSEQNQDQNQQQNKDQSEGDSQDDSQGQQDQQPSDQQQSPDEPPSEQDSKPGDDPSDPSDQEGEPNEREEESQQADEPEQQPAEEKPEPGEAQEQAAAEAEGDPEDAEKDQAMQQWLRRVPDDPSGLLREKFRYESRQRLQQNNGETRNNESYW